MAHGRIERISLFADVPDPLFEREAAYWQTITATTAGEPMGEDGEFLPLNPAGSEAVLWLQAVARDEPGWHLDLYPSDVAVTARHAVDLGATTVRQADWWVTLASPGGLAFCLTRSAGASPAVPPAVGWPGGHRSGFDQLSLDIPDAIYDTECAFWAALTGWPCRPTDVPEFAHLAWPDDIAVRILLQRLGPDDARGMRAHADIATDDRTAEVARHVAAGGTVLRTETWWTVLRDPAGLLYCITDRRLRG